MIYPKRFRVFLISQPRPPLQLTIRHSSKTWGNNLTWANNLEWDSQEILEAPVLIKAIWAVKTTNLPCRIKVIQTLISSITKINHIKARVVISQIALIKIRDLTKILSLINNFRAKIMGIICMDSRLARQCRARARIKETTCMGSNLAHSSKTKEATNMVSSVKWVDKVKVLSQTIKGISTNLHRINSI